MFALSNQQYKPQNDQKWINIIKMMKGKVGNLRSWNHEISLHENDLNDFQNAWQLIFCFSIN